MYMRKIRWQGLLRSKNNSVFDTKFVIVDTTQSNQNRISNEHTHCNYKKVTLLSNILKASHKYNKKNLDDVLICIMKELLLWLKY